jgi:2-polyprenyl-3-methyl-5-hydroxy-6-metoxy-1,4-benzoquinol methylase
MERLRDFLRDRYEIMFERMGCDVLGEAEALGVRPSRLDELDRLIAVRASEEGTGSVRFDQASRKFYDLIACDPIQGLMHSWKWTFIFDVAAYATAICRMGSATGGILDVGCHTGYHSLWLAHALGLQVVGLDESNAALVYARMKAAKLGLLARCSFASRSALAAKSPGQFEFVLASDGPVEFSSQSLLQWKKVLAPEGLMMLVEDNLPPKGDLLLGVLRSAGLRLLHIDVVGGWTAEGLQSKMLYLLAHGEGSSVEGDEMAAAERVWDDGFRAYCNNPSRQLEHKTLGQYRTSVVHGQQ